MKDSYFSLIKQTYQFPQKGFDINKQKLSFHGVSIPRLIEKYGTPFRLSYLPQISNQINNSKELFNKAFKNHNYKGKYQYCYCTKCNHYSHIIKSALKENINLETSSTFDIDIILSLYKKQNISVNITIIHNGYKTDDYLKKIFELQSLGFNNSIIILDSSNELSRILEIAPDTKFKIGLRMAINEEAKSSFNSSRLGIPSNEVLNFYKTKIQNNELLELKMLHFFVDSGIQDKLYYWGEFRTALNLFIDLSKVCSSIDSFNIGGGFPIQNQLNFNYDYEYIIDKIVSKIKTACSNEKIKNPDIYTEFGKYTVGESGAIIFKVLEQKKQNDNENWYIIDNSLLNTIPDAWYLHEKFILLPINKWDKTYQKVNIGGISCDQSDYYNSEDMNQEILLPKYDNSDTEPLYLGFFHTGAYQDAVSGYGGLKHCLIPSPKQIIIDQDQDGNLFDYQYSDELNKSEMFKILGY